MYINLLGHFETNAYFHKLIKMITKKIILTAFKISNRNFSVKFETHINFKLIRLQTCHNLIFVYESGYIWMGVLFGSITWGISVDGMLVFLFFVYTFMYILSPFLRNNISIFWKSTLRTTRISFGSNDSHCRE